MAAITYTAVRTTSTTQTRNVQYGATVAAGQPLYLDSTDSEHKLADNNVTATTAEAKGIALTPGVDAGGGVIAYGGSVVFVGATMTVGDSYYVGATAGEIVPQGDLTTGHYVTRLGTAASATQLNLNIEATGIVHA